MDDVRERALLAINDGCLLGYDPPSAEQVIDAIEAAGLRIVDAREHDALIARANELPGIAATLDEHRWLADRASEIGAAEAQRRACNCDVCRERVRRALDALVEGVYRAPGTARCPEVG